LGELSPPSYVPRVSSLGDQVAERRRIEP